MSVKAAVGLPQKCRKASSLWSASLQAGHAQNKDADPTRSSPLASGQALHVGEELLLRQHHLAWFPIMINCRRFCLPFQKTGKISVMQGLCQAIPQPCRSQAFHPRTFDLIDCAVLSECDVIYNWDISSKRINICWVLPIYQALCRLLYLYSVRFWQFYILLFSFHIRMGRLTPLVHEQGSGRPPSCTVTTEIQTHCCVPRLIHRHLSNGYKGL